MRHHHLRHVGLHTAYRGLYNPVATNTDPTGQAANRRVSLALG